MRYQQVRAVVLGSRVFGEADRIAVLFTREIGRADAVVKGVRRTKSRWGGRLEPFNVCDLVLYRGRSLFTVTSAQFVVAFDRLRTDLEAMAAASVVCEAAAALFPEEEPQERVFNLLCHALTEIDKGMEGRAAEAPLLAGALVKLLHEAGYLPVLDHCAACGADGRALGFSAARGGLVCSDCVGEAVPITPEAIEALAASLSRPLAELREQPSSDATGEALRDVHQLYAYHTGSRLRALRIAGGG
jgi:DNA repair protein RecO (recombination protein O)